MPGIYVIGGSTETPEDVLMQANRVGEWNPPMPYQLVLARHVSRVQEMERIIHSLLEELGLRIHSQGPFFRVPRCVVEKLFCLANGREIPEFDEE